MAVSIAVVLGVLGAIAATILVYIFIMPRKKDGKFSNSFGQFLHNLFHFKRLFIADIVKATYIFSTAMCILCGFFMLFCFDTYETYSYYGGFETETISYAPEGIMTMLLGPILLRLAYEGTMMMILLVQNVTEINNKIKKSDAPATPVAPVAPVTPVQTWTPQQTWEQPTYQPQTWEQPVYQPPQNQQ